MFKKYFSKTFHRILLEKLLKEKSSIIHGKILDIGSKNRRYDHLFDGEIVAIDLSTNEEKNVIFGNIEKGLGFDDESFDAVICIEVFEYIENYEKAIEEIFRLMKSGGKAIITVPFMYHEHGDKLRYTRVYMKNMFSRFKEVGITNIGNGFVVIWDVLAKKIRYINSRILRYFLYLLILPYLIILKLLKLEMKEDNYYSGLFIVLEK